MDSLKQSSIVLYIFPCFLHFNNIVKNRTLQNIFFFVFHKIKTGYLMVRREGRWGKLCMQNFETAVEKLRQSFQVNDLGKAVCRELTFT